VRGWGDALRALDPTARADWSIFAPAGVFEQLNDGDLRTLGQLGSEFQVVTEPELELRVPQRSFRSPNVSKWVDQVLAGDFHGAAAAASSLNAYPLVLTRSLQRAKEWLTAQGRGERRFGLLASSGARRLRADGLGVLLHASAGDEIAHWYLNDHDDVRSSLALEVPANEYTCQGLEVDFTCLCWGGDLLWDAKLEAWRRCRFGGTEWQNIRSPEAQRFLTNSYRVLLTRAREGMVLWIPTGSDCDRTRKPEPFNETAQYLMACGVRNLDA
jgi:hypothetical protein